MSRHLSTRGFAMSEVLVALLVIAVAVSSALALALGGLVGTAEARRAELATMLAADLAGRIRSLAGVDWTALPGSGCTPPCTPDQLAAQELDHWRASVRDALPSGRGELESGNGDELTASVRWEERGGVPREFRLGIGR
jgi:type IV pilus assembly protein PilV